jgi:hypothetical protein
MISQSTIFWKKQTCATNKTLKKKRTQDLDNTVDDKYCYSFNDSDQS